MGYILSAKLSSLFGILFQHLELSKDLKCWMRSMGDTSVTVRVGTGTNINHFLSKWKLLNHSSFCKKIKSNLCTTYWTCNSRILQPGIFPLGNFIIWKLNKKNCNTFFSPSRIPFFKTKTTTTKTKQQQYMVRYYRRIKGLYMWICHFKEQQEAFDYLWVSFSHPIPV